MPSDQSTLAQQMKEELRELRAFVQQMAAITTRLSVLEERNLVAMQALEKMLARQGHLEQKVATIELEQVKFQATAAGAGKAIKICWGLAGGGLTAAGSYLLRHLAAG